MSQTPPDEAYTRVRDVLKRHVGRENAITKADLTRLAGLSDKRECELVLELCKDRFPFVVVGSSAGMYVATNPADLNREHDRRYSYIKSISHGWKSIKQRARALGWKWENGRFVEAPVQQELFTL